jgi:hypothetical protein
MLTQHPTLLIGPSDWQPERFPRAEFDRRIAALWQAHPNATQAIVFGSAAHHAELAYLTNFVPKLEPGIALLTRRGEHKLLFGGGPNMIGAMKPLTFITEMAPLNALAKSISGWTPLLIGGGTMSTATRKTVAEATNDTAQDATPTVLALMRRKSLHEVNVIRNACTVLDAAIAAIGDAQRAGGGITDAVLAGERAAVERDAQDIRTLFSVDGGCTLRPFEALDSRRIDPLQIYAAVRMFNYWAEGFSVFSERPHEPAGLAMALLGAALTTIKPGRATEDIADAVASAAGPYREHPVTQGALVGPIGFALDDPPLASGMFEPGDVHSIRVGLSDGADRHAIVSAMIAVGENECDVLWRGGIA